MQKKVALAVAIATAVLCAQDVGIEGGAYTDTIMCGYSVPRPILKPAGPDLEDMEWKPWPASQPLKSLKINAPYPTLVKLNTIISLTEGEAIALGAPKADIDRIKERQNRYSEKFGPGYAGVRFFISRMGSYVGKPRKTYAILCLPDDANRNSNAFNAFGVKDLLTEMGWSNTTYNKNPAFSDFTGTNCTVNSSNSDISFYFGHGYTGGYGPSVPGFDYNFHNMIDWGLSSGRQRGARWFMMQSCQWFRPEYDQLVSGNLPPKMLASGNLSRWSNAFSEGRGSLHGIFGYASDAASFSSTDIPKHVHNFNLTNLAPVAAINGMKNGACMGDAWFQGPRTQTKYQYNGGPGYVPACITICNRTHGDYFYEKLGDMYPDPIDVPDDEATLVFHYEYFNSEDGTPPSW